MELDDLAEKLKDRLHHAALEAQVCEHGNDVTTEEPQISQFSQSQRSNKDVEIFDRLLEACNQSNGVFTVHAILDGRRSLKRFQEQNKGKSLLVQAIECGNEEIVRYLVEDDSTSFCCLKEDGTFEGKTPICLALESNQRSLVRVIIDVLEHLQPEDVILVLDPSNNQTILHDVCARGSRALALLLKRLSSNSKSATTFRQSIWTAATALVDDLGYTPLLLSAKHGRFSILYALLDCCTSERQLQSAFERTNYLGENMFHFACWHGPLLLHFDLYFLRRIIQQWKMDHLVFQPAAHNGWTPLHYACCSGKSGLVRHLLEHGACTKMMNVPGIFLRSDHQKRDNSPIQSPEATLSLPTSPEAPFLLAASRRNLDIFKVFVEAAEKSQGAFGIDVNATNAQGKTLLHFAIDLDRRDVVQQLLSKAKNDETPVYNKINLCLAEYEQGNTPLHLLCVKGWLDEIRLAAHHMSSFGHQICTRINQQGQTPLMVAAIHGHFSTVQFLVEACSAELAQGATSNIDNHVDTSSLK